MADSPVSIQRVNPPELGVPPGYSQIVVACGGHIISIAGQTALDQNGEIVGKDNVAMQASQVFRNLAVALRSVGCTAANLSSWLATRCDNDLGLAADIAGRRPQHFHSNIAHAFAQHGNKLLRPNWL